MSESKAVPSESGTSCVLRANSLVLYSSQDSPGSYVSPAMWRGRPTWKLAFQGPHRPSVEWTAEAPLISFPSAWSQEALFLWLGHLMVNSPIMFRLLVLFPSCATTSPGGNRPVISAPRRLKREDSTFKSRQSYVLRLCLNKKWWE